MKPNFDLSSDDIGLSVFDLFPFSEKVFVALIPLAILAPMIIIGLLNNSNFTDRIQTGQTLSHQHLKLLQLLDNLLKRCKAIVLLYGFVWSV